MHLTADEKKAYLRFVALYPKILIIGWLISLPSLLFRNIYPFIFFAIVLIFYNAFVMLKFNIVLFEGTWVATGFEMFVPWRLRKDANAQKSKVTKWLGAIFLTSGILSLIVTAGVMSNILS